MAWISLTVPELNRIEEQKEKDTFYQLPFNMATVTIFTDGTATLFPGAGMGDGLFFSDLKVMETMIQSKVFPVTGTDSIWEAEKERLLKLNDSINVYTSQLSDLLGIELKFTAEESFLQLISQRLNDKIQSQALSPELEISVAIFIGEIIRRKHTGRWVLFPQFTLNVYYIPELTVANSYCDPIHEVLSAFAKSSNNQIDLHKIASQIEFFPIENRRYVDVPSD
jgi:hypothetical protein